MMGLFRRESKKRDMAEKETADRDWPEDLEPDEAANRIRVTDRRRFRDLDAEDSAADPAASRRGPDPQAELRRRARGAHARLRAEGRRRSDALRAGARRFKAR